MGGRSFWFYFREQIRSGCRIEGLSNFFHFIRDTCKITWIHVSVYSSSDIIEMQIVFFLIWALPFTMKMEVFLYIDLL